MKFIEISTAVGKLHIAVDKIHALQPHGYPAKATRIFTGPGEDDYWTAYENTSEILRRIESLTLPMPPAETADTGPHAPGADERPNVADDIQNTD